MSSRSTNGCDEGGNLLDLLKKFEKAGAVTLVAMMAIVVLLATSELGGTIIKDIITPPVLRLENHGPQDIFGLFLLVLIGVERLGTIKAVSGTAGCLSKRS